MHVCLLNEILEMDSRQVRSSKEAEDPGESGQAESSKGQQTWTCDVALTFQEDKEVTADVEQTSLEGRKPLCPHTLGIGLLWPPLLDHPTQFA